MSKTVTIVLNVHKDLETFGSHSLLGRLREENPGVNLAEDVDVIVIRLQETSIEWRRHHSGAAAVVVPEYVFACLCEDVAILSRWGIHVDVVSDEVLMEA